VKCHITSLLVQDSYFGGHHCDTAIVTKYVEHRWLTCYEPAEINIITLSCPTHPVCLHNPWSPHSFVLQVITLIPVRKTSTWTVEKIKYIRLKKYHYYTYS